MPRVGSINDWPALLVIAFTEACIDNFIHVPLSEITCCHKKRLGWFSMIHLRFLKDGMLQPRYPEPRLSFFVSTCFTILNGATKQALLYYSLLEM